MKTKVTDALFVATAVVPALLVCTGRPALALLALCVLLFSACLLSMYFDQTRPERRDAS